MSGVEKVAEKMAEAFDEPYRWVCDRCGHVGDSAKKKRHGEERTGVCEECGGPATLKATTVSGKKRKPHSLKRFEERDEDDRDGPPVVLEPLPDNFQLSEHQLDQLERGGRPTITMPKTATITPLLPGHLYECGEVDLFIAGVREEESELVVDYVVHRSEQSVREDAAPFDRAATRQGMIVDLETGEEVRGIPEPERVSKAAGNDLTRQVLECQLSREKEQHSKGISWLNELERDFTRDQTWGAKKQVDILAARVEATETRIKELSRRRPKGKK